MISESSGKGDFLSIDKSLLTFVLITLSFFDAEGKNPEAVFQAFILGMLLNLGAEYEISSNRELGCGRLEGVVLLVHFIIIMSCFPMHNFRTGTK